MEPKIQTAEEIAKCIADATPEAPCKRLGAEATREKRARKPRVKKAVAA